MDADMMHVVKWHRVWLLLACLGCLALYGRPLAAERSIEWTFSEKYSVDDAAYASLVRAPVIQSFDIAPDGKELAVLVRGGRVDDPVWIAIEDITTKRRIATRRLDSSASGLTNGDFAPQVLYTKSGSLVVNDLTSIRILDGNTLQTVATVRGPDSVGTSPLRAVVARQAELVACAFGVPGRFDPHVHNTPVTVQIVSTSNGTPVRAFSAPDVPQDISPDGRLLVRSAQSAVRGLLPIAVVSDDGRLIAESSAGFAFNAGPSQVSGLGRIVGAFIGLHERSERPWTRSGNGR